MSMSIMFLRVVDKIRMNRKIVFVMGGARSGGITGLILGAASRRVPVVIDGFISTAGALIASALEPAAKDYMFAIL
jgi:NaMN:DMB phosphoribosyltransferase